MNLIKLVAASEDAFSGKKDKPKSLIETLRKKLKTLLLQEAAKKEKLKNTNDTLSNILVDQCITNFVYSTESSEKVENRVEESLHPYYSPANYTGEIRVRGAKSLRVCFDSRCATYESSASLTFFSDKECDTRIVQFSGDNANFKPFIVHSDRVFYKVYLDFNLTITFLICFIYKL